MRGLGWLVSNTSSRASSPGPGLPMPVPEVISSGLAEPFSASPIALMTRASFSQLATKLEKSWSKAQWITASAFAAPSARLWGSSRSPRCASAPAAASALAPASERVMPQHLMAAREEFGDDPGADEAGGSGEEHAHGRSPLVVGDGYRPKLRPVTVVTLSGYSC